MTIEELKKDFEYNYPFLAKNILDMYGTTGYNVFIHFFLSRINRIEDQVRGLLFDVERQLNQCPYGKPRKLLLYMQDKLTRILKNT